MKKKILALILSLSLILTLFTGIGSITASAEIYYTATLRYADNGTTITILGPSWEYGGTSFSIPETINGKPVTEIGYMAFYGFGIHQLVLQAVSQP